MRFAYRRRRPVRGFALLRHQIADAFRFMLDGRSWRRHPAPFSKTERGRQRRAERQFVRQSHILEA